MLSRLFSSKKRLLGKAAELISLTTKVIQYRKDILDQNVLEHLISLQERLLKSVNASKIDVAVLEQDIHALDKLLTRHGGTLYPVTFLRENVETFIVAALLALSVRAFFLQPFKIPTNSMYPTYAGMLPRVLQLDQPKLGSFQQLKSILLEGATTHKAISPTDGTVYIPLFNENDTYRGLGHVRFERVSGRKWFGLLPAEYRAYSLIIDETPVSIQVPWDFNLDEVIRQTYFPQAASFDELYHPKIKHVAHPSLGIQASLRTGITVKKGTPILYFQILTGDMLFVDRLTYHFRKPKVGEAIVFHTRKIPSLQNSDYEDDKYYIKRLVGIGNDKLQIDEPMLLRNGFPITGSRIFDYNNYCQKNYKGYQSIRNLRRGRIEHVPSHHFYAMGDNSFHSADSRYWGFVPEKEVVGKPLFIFYPFKGRFGFAL
jgi:signal peptidase I